MRNIKWDIEEAILLADLFFRTIESSAIERGRQIKELSKILNYRAETLGIEKDSSFRNISGIQMKLENIRHVYTKGQSGLKSISNMDVAVVDLYMNNNVHFQEQLQQIKERYNWERTSVQYRNDKTSGVAEMELDKLNVFAHWLKGQKKINDKMSVAIIESLRNLNDFVLKQNYLKYELWEINALEDVQKIVSKIQKNKLYAVKNKLNKNSFDNALNLYLDYLKYSDSNKDNLAEPAEKYVAEEQNDFVVDFASIQTYVDTCPTKIVMNKKIQYVHNWNDVLLKVCEELISYNPRQMKKFVKEQLFSATTRLYFSETSAGLTSGHLLSNGVWVETNFSPKDIVVASKALCEKCGYSLDAVTIYYSVSKNVSTKLEQTQSEDDKVKDVQYYLDKSILEDAQKEYKYILDKYFQKGFKLSSIISRSKFKRLYSQEFTGKEIITDDRFNDAVIKMCINYNDGLYMTPETAVSDQSLLEDILRFVLTAFKENKKALYYEGMYQMFFDRLIDTNIYNAMGLKALLMYYLGNDFCFKKSYLAISNDVEVSPVEEIEELLLENDAPMDKESIMNKLPHISKPKIVELLKSNKKIIYVQKNLYWHIDKFELTENDKALLDDIIRYEIQDGFISVKKLLEKLKVVASGFIENNYIVNHVCLKDILKYYFENDFSFKYTFIGKFGEEMSAIAAVNRYIEDREMFTLTELIEFVQENDLPKDYELFIDKATNNFIRINKEEFVRKENIRFNIFDIEEVVSKYMENGYVLINQIENYSIFPDIGTSWNKYLLEDLINKYSMKYNLLSCSSSVTKTIGVIVDTESAFKTYESILVDVISKQSHILDINNEKIVIEYLYSNGYLAQRRLKNYNEIISMIK